jgi:hypothetical protein
MDHKKNLEKEIKMMWEQDPKKFKKRIIGEQKGIITSIIIAGFDKNIPIAYAINFTVDESKREIKTTHIRCPGDCQNGVELFYLGKADEIKKYVSNLGSNFNMSPEAFAKYLVNLEIKAGTPGVGPPIDLIVITKDGVKWLSRKKECTGCPEGYIEPIK